MEHGRESDQESRASSKNSENESKKMKEKKESKSETENSSPEEESEEEVQSQERGMAIDSNYHIVGEGGVRDEEEDAFVDEEQSGEEEEISADEEQFDMEEDVFTHETESSAPEEEENEEGGESRETGVATNSSYRIVGEEELSGDDKDDSADEEQSDDPDMEEDAFADESKRKEKKRSNSETERSASEVESDEAFQPRETKKMKREMNNANSRNMQKVVHAGPNPPPPPPPDFKNCIQTLSKGQEISISDEILVIQKQLSEIEVNQQSDRFSIPLGIIWNELFNDDEIKKLNAENVIRVTMIDPVIETDFVDLRRILMMPKDKGRSEPRRARVLERGWNRFTTAKNLEGGDIVQLWAVRVAGNLCFLLVKLSRGTGDSSGGNTSNAGSSDTRESET